MRSSNITHPLVDRYRRVKAGFVSQGTTLHAWCVGEGLKRQNVAKALLGEWTGPKALKLVARALEASGVKE